MSEWWCPLLVADMCGVRSIWPRSLMTEAPAAGCVARSPSSCANYPSLLHSHQIVCGRLYCLGVVYAESSVPGQLEFTTLYGMDTGGIPSWMACFVVRVKGKNADNLGHLIRLLRITGDNTELQKGGTHGAG